MPVFLAACGSDDSANETTTVTEQATGGTGPRGPSGVASSAAPSKSEAVAVVERFYRMLNSYRYREAWSLVPQSVRAESGGYAEWRAGYRSNLNSSPRDLSVDTSTAERAVVSLDLEATDIDACSGKRVDQVFTGTWTLTAVDRSWQPQAISLDKVSGGTPALNASDCAPEPSPGPSADSSCESGYDPCVPTYPPDVDCPEVGGPVAVTGSDLHGLDADGDGTGCEL